MNSLRTNNSVPSYNPLASVKSMLYKFVAPSQDGPSIPRSRSRLNTLYPSEIIQSAEHLLEGIARDQREQDRHHFVVTDVEAMLKGKDGGRLKSLEQITSLKVLGVEISHWSQVKQYAFITACIFAVQIAYGYAQEYVVMSVFQRKLGLFIALLQFCGYAFFAGSQCLLEGRSKRLVPMRYYVILILMQAANLCLTNIAMQYVNYTAKVLFKSSKIIPTMLFGMLYHKKRYSFQDYTAVAFIVLGLLIFLQADAKNSPSHDKIGIILLCICLFLEGAVINIQEELMNFYCCQPSEYIYYMYSGGIFVMLGVTALSGELWQGVEFLWEQ